MTAGVLLFAVPAAAAYALAYRQAGDARREALRWAAVHFSWITVTAAITVTLWRA